MPREIKIRTGERSLTLTVDRLPSDYKGIRAEFGDDCVDRHADSNLYSAYCNVGRPLMRDGATDEAVIAAVNAYDPTQPKTRTGATIEQRAENAARKQCAQLVTATEDTDYAFDNLTPKKQSKMVANHLARLQAKLEKAEANGE